MTTPVQNESFQSIPAGQSRLPFDEKDLLSIRLLPAEFSRAVGVSKQTVSRWIKDNKVTIGADGRMNPTIAMRQLLRNGDPGRMRARLVRQAINDTADMRAQAARSVDLEQQLADARVRLQYLESYSQELGLASELAADVLTDSIEEIRAASGREELRSVFADLLDRALLVAAARLDDGEINHSLDTAARSVAMEEGAELEDLRKGGDDGNH